MTLPGSTVTVEIGFADDPGTALGSVTWTDVTEWVEELRIRRGRDRDLDRIEAGTCTVRLENRDGRFDPANTSSPYYPNVKPMRRLRVTATDTTPTTHTVFVGFIDEWPQTWAHLDATTVVKATDAFKILARRSLPDSVYAHEVMADEPIHWYRLGESAGTMAVDQGSKRLHGEYFGSPSLGTSGLVEHDPDTAVTFDGTDDAIRVDSSLAGVSGAPFSVEFIFNPVAGVGEWIAEQGARDTSSGWVVDYNAAITFLSFRDRFNNLGAAINNYTAGVDRHIVCRSDGSTAEIFVNGSDDTNSSGVDKGDGFNGLAIGASTVRNMFHFEGVLDEVAIYDTALSDARILAHARARTAAWNGDTSDERIERILDLAGWPDADRDIGTGVTTFGDADINGSDALSYIMLAAESESGVFYIAASGQATFVGRHELITATNYNTSQVTLADDPGSGELPYDDIALDSFSVDQVFNDVRVQRKFGVEQVAEDATSQDAYLRRTLSESGLLMDSDAEALSRAQLLLDRHREPRIRVERVALRPTLDPEVFEYALGLDLLSRVTVKRVDQPSGVQWEQDCHIQGVEHSWSEAVGEWVTAWWLSPADLTNYLILDDATFGKLDTGALAY